MKVSMDAGSAKISSKCRRENMSSARCSIENPRLSLAGCMTRLNELGSSSRTGSNRSASSRMLLACSGGKAWIESDVFVDVIDPTEPAIFGEFSEDELK